MKHLNPLQSGPGLNALTANQAGRFNIPVYHPRSFKEISGGNALGNPDRATHAQVLQWNADGMPNFGVPVSDGVYRVPEANE